MAWTRRFEEAEPQRINKWLGQSGVCSRREAEGLIERGLVSIDGEVVKDAGRKIQPGQTLVLADGEGAAPLSVVEGQQLRFILKEGRNRQIRRMCELVGMHVMDLVRVRIGSLNLGDLPEGKWRVLGADERAALTGG
jgi:pseudouridine synthase